MKQEIYRNLHSDCFSVRQQGKVVAHILKGSMANVEFVVQPAGNAKVRREKRKNVHAFVRGVRETCPSNETREYQRVIYNPYQATTFTLKDGTPVHYAEHVIFSYPAVYASGVR